MDRRLNERGELVIPSSVRPDGSVRRERRVRPGYRPPEEVPLYRAGRGGLFGRSRRGRTGVPETNAGRAAQTATDTRPSRDKESSPALSLVDEVGGERVIGEGVSEEGGGAESPGRARSEDDRGRQSSEELDAVLQKIDELKIDG